MKQLMAIALSILFAFPACASTIPEKMADSTVLIRMKMHRVEDNKEGWGNCSGVYIQKNIILSAAHCVNVPEGIELKQLWIKKGNESERAIITRIDIAADLLLLYTPLEGTPVKLARKAVRRWPGTPRRRPAR